MTAKYEGSLTLGEILPLPLLAQTYLGATLDATVPDAQARLNGLVQASLQPPPALQDLIASLLRALEAAKELLANPLPVVSFAAIAELQALIGQFQIAIGFNANFAALLGTPGIHYILFEGKAEQVAPDVNGILAGGLPGYAQDQYIAGAMVLAADGGAVKAFQTVFKS